MESYEFLVWENMIASIEEKELRNKCIRRSTFIRNQKFTSYLFQYNPNFRKGYRKLRKRFI